MLHIDLSIERRESNTNSDQTLTTINNSEPTETLRMPDIKTKWHSSLTAWKIV